MQWCPTHEKLHNNDEQHSYYLKKEYNLIHIVILNDKNYNHYTHSPIAAGKILMTLFYESTVVNAHSENN